MAKRTALRMSAGKLNRVRVKAKHYQHQVEKRRDLPVIGNPPRIRRMFQIEIWTGIGTDHTYWRPYVCDATKHIVGEQVKKHGKNKVTIKKAWQVFYGRNHAHSLGHLWFAVEYARAERDGLNYHYAHHIMTGDPYGASESNELLR